MWCQSIDQAKGVLMDLIWRAPMTHLHVSSTTHLKGKTTKFIKNMNASIFVMIHDKLNMQDCVS